MTINQLFRKHPTNEGILQILELYNLSNLDDQKSFTKKDLQQFETVKKINENLSLFEELYLPCKAKLYLADLTEKKCITIFQNLWKFRSC